ncbi:MAG: 3-hydroxyacyl-CoA dehydrogenase NAD-binding domain-containing protein [Methylohalobius sp. ZOD2]|nr:enoyl-CoA hydratase/isomerase family protein [Methylothermaceae bacterium]
MATLRHFRLKTDNQGIAWLHFDHAESNANVLSADVLAELGSVLDRFHKNPPRGLVILSDKPSGFIAGADVKEFTHLTERHRALNLIQVAHKRFESLATLPCPTLARIHGYCLGGGLELALACRYRVALDDAKTRLGLPEVLLGIHPGFGGSVRLIRRIGAPAAFQLMLSGRTVDAAKAARLGLVDHAVPERHWDRACRQILKTQPPQKRPSRLATWADTAPVRPLLAFFLNRQVAKRAPAQHYPAPHALIDLWRRHGAHSDSMFQAEAESVADLLLSDTSRNLVRMFFLRERLKGLGKESADFARVHVVGAGTMGGDIAAWCASKGLTASLQDREPKYIAPAVKRAYRLFKRRFKAKHEETAARDRLIPDPKGFQVDRADIVVEAIVENLDVKRALYREIEPELAPDALLATNTSSLPLEELAAGLQHPERLVGIHFFNPVAKMQLVEVVRGSHTDDDSADRAAAFVRAIDRLPLPVKSAPGFLVNRVLMPYLLEAVVLLEEGIPADAVDRAATEFGMPMGPIRLADTVGLDICLAVAEILTENLGGEVPRLLRDKVAAGELGVKSGTGFYRYQRDKPIVWRKSTSSLPRRTIEERLILRLLNECVAVLREKVVEDPDLVDAGMVFGAGFAPFRGGPMHYLKQHGIAETQQKLAEFAFTYGPRFQPDPGWDKLQIPA